ncbi:MAG: type III restriction endonuclease subunit R, partial [Gammaproteobacteria bacterium]
DEPTEIVIHVNMLKEGWDVTNLYTIVPLRAANARTLIEQSIGRGLRLPYGRKTGVEAVDRLNIIAHDKFQEVIDEAGRADSPIRLKQLKLDPVGDAIGGLRSLAVTPTIDVLLGIGEPKGTMLPRDAVAETRAVYGAEQSAVARATMRAIDELSRQNDLLPTLAELARPEVQELIVERVRELVTPAQSELLPTDGPSVAEIVEQTMTLVAQHTIAIPRILIKPKGTVKSGYRSFTLDVSKMSFQPQDQQLLSRGLQSGADVLYGQSSMIAETRLEDYIVRELINYDDVSYDEHADLIYGLAGQAVLHFRSYLKTDAELNNVLANQGRAIAENVHAQMAQHYFEDIGESEVVISQGFTPLKQSAVTAEGDVLPLHEAPPDRSRIATVVYGGFRKCAYTYQKFHSDTERVLAQIVERDALLWFRPVGGQFNIYYRRGADQPEYIPDFVASTDDINLLIETKKVADMEAEEVLAKARAAMIWCAHASDYARQHGQKQWRYLLIPHDAVASSATLKAFAERFRVS